MIGVMYAIPAIGFMSGYHPTRDGPSYDQRMTQMGQPLPLPGAPQMSQSRRKRPSAPFALP
jgi:hypothetical protein